MNSKNKKKILVAVNDAGGGEILSAYILANKKKFYFLCFANGPAAKIFTRDRVPFQKVSDNQREIAGILKKHEDLSLVLTGTGWMTNIEINFLKEAKRHGIRSAAFIDHWVNYRERFGYPKEGWNLNMPDEIWVGDNDALKIAKSFFKNKIVIMVANPYWKRMKSSFKKLKKNGAGSGILYLSEPNTHTKTVLTRIFEFLAHVGFKDKIYLRLHPAEKRTAYNKIIERFKDRLMIVKSKSKNLLADIADVKTVVGMDTMALAVSAICGRKTISFISPEFGTSSLPLSEIIKIKRVEELGRVLT